MKLTYDLLDIRSKMKRALYIQKVLADSDVPSLISGSLALIFQGAIDPRKVNDIDICIPSSPETIRQIRTFQRSNFSTLQAVMKGSVQPNIFPFSVSVQRLYDVPNSYAQNYYDAFYMSEQCDGIQLLGMMFHKVEHIMAAKKVIGRPKDKKDIKQWKNGFLVRPFPTHLLPVGHKHFK